MKTQTLAFSVLVTTALVMALILVILPPRTPQAQAEMMATGRDYTLIAGPLNSNVSDGDDILHVIDNRTGNMLTFVVNNQGLQAVGKGKNLFVQSR